MKAITIRQPWSSLIVHGIKDIENRTWPCSKKYIGQRVLIHASARPDDEPYAIFNDEQALAIDDIIMDVCGYYHLTGSIIGSVEIVGCSINHSSIWAEKTPNYVNSLTPKVYEEVMGRKIIYNWVLANPVLFEKPIPAKGKLSFWDYTGDLPFDEVLESNKDVLKRIKEKGDK